MHGQQGFRRVGGLVCLGLLALAPTAHAQDPVTDPPPPAVAPAPTPPPPPPPAARGVDSTYRGSGAALAVSGDVLTLDLGAAHGALAARLSTPQPVRVTAACSDDVLGLDVSRPRAGHDVGDEQLLTPDAASATVRMTIPGLGDRVAAGANGCRATVAEPLGYRVDDVAVGFTPDTRYLLFTQSLRTTERNRQALAAAEAAVTSALTHYVTHHDDLRSWTPTADGRVPGEATLQLRTAPSIGALALKPASDDLVYLVVPAVGPRSRDKLTIVAPSTAIDGRLVVIGRDLRTGRLRYQVLDRARLRVRYDGDTPPFAPCSDPLMPSRCTDQGRRTPGTRTRATSAG